MKGLAVLTLLLLAASVHAAPAQKVSPLEMAKRAFESGRSGRALQLLDEALSRKLSAGERGLAYYYQGLSLYDMGYPFAAYLSFRNVLLKPDPSNTQVYEKAIKNAVVIADRLNLTDRLGKVIERLPSSYIPPAVSSVASYAVGVYQAFVNKDSAAESSLKSVPPDNPFYYKAQFHLGVLATKRKDYNDASVYFRKAVQITQDNKSLRDMEDLSKLNLARSAYSAGDMEKSIEYYARFSSSSPFWLTVLLEASWPLMRVNDTTVSLGNLHTLTSPFYQEELVGEAYVLKATILFALCKYEEMRRTLSQFFEIYDKVVADMQKEKSRLDGTDAFFRAFAKGEGLNRAFLSMAKRDPALERDMKILRMLQEEKANIGRLSQNKQIKKMMRAFDETTRFLAAKIGRDLKRLHERKLSELIVQREQANYLKVEIVTGEKELIESSQGLPPKRITEVETKVFPEYHFWPWKGEYWEDELGSYVYTTESSCVGVN